MNRETRKAMQDSYLEARSQGHTKEEARGIRDNWKPSKISSSNSSNDDDDDDYYYSDDSDIDYEDPDFDDYDH